MWCEYYTSEALRQAAATSPRNREAGKDSFTVKEVAEVIGTSDKSVRRLQKCGFFKSSSALRTKQIPRSEIERYKAETV